MMLQNALNPDIKNDQIWRYMSYKRFRDLIETGSLFFCPITRYQQDSEPLEASMTSGYKAAYENNYYDRRRHREQFFHPRFETPNDEFEDLCKRTFVNCWHRNTDENFAFWMIYGNKERHDSVAIISTPQKLQTSIRNGGSVEELNTRMTAMLLIDKVKYVNHFNEDFEATNEQVSKYQPFFYKHLGYRYEKEIRVLLSFNAEGADPEPYARFVETKKIKVKLDELISEVWIGFKSSRGFKEDVEVLLRKAGISVQVKMSNLYTEPIRPSSEPK
ncbi:hypothetical protein [Desulfocastanea catecholica]